MVRKQTLLFSIWHPPKPCRDLALRCVESVMRAARFDRRPKALSASVPLALVGLIFSFFNQCKATVLSLHDADDLFPVIPDESVHYTRHSVPWAIPAHMEAWLNFRNWL